MNVRFRKYLVICLGLVVVGLAVVGVQMAARLVFSMKRWDARSIDYFQRFHNLEELRQWALKELAAAKRGDSSNALLRANYPDSVKESGLNVTFGPMIVGGNVPDPPEFVILSALGGRLPISEFVIGDQDLGLVDGYEVWPEVPAKVTKIGAGVYYFRGTKE